MIKLNLIVLRADDVPALVRFYTALGMQFEAHQHGKGAPHWAWEAADGTVFEIYPKRNAADSTQSVRLGFAVPNIEQTLAGLNGHSYTVISAPKLSQWGKRAVVDDPEGHRIELIERSV